MNELLTLEDIAKMYSVPLKRARDAIVKSPGFPPEAPGSSPRNRRWLRSEVLAFINRKPANIPHTVVFA